MLKNIEFSLVREINELKNQFSTAKRIGFFFGAGTSMGLGIPGITELTKKVEESLVDRFRTNFIKVKEGLQDFIEPNCCVSVEDVLNQLRLIRQITRESSTKTYEGINGQEARELDVSICNEIYRIISEKENTLDFSITKKFVAWLNWLNREYSKEIFTTNYDLVFEKALESLNIPYFDGFVGANQPFFLPESIESKNKYDFPPLSWIRLWKIHGSFGWFWHKNDNTNSYKVVRLGVLAKCADKNNELVIYPSREKYESSRKQPFLTYFDRLKNYLQHGESLFVINGYSFSDEHINEIIFNSLKQNNKLHIITFLHSDNRLNKIRDLAIPHLNMSVYSPNMAIIGGLVGKWNLEGTDELNMDYCLDQESKSINLGNFPEFVGFLIKICGKEDIIEKEIGEKN